MKHIRAIVVYTVIWVVWNERMDWYTLVMGLSVSSVAWLVSNLLMERDHATHAFSLSLAAYARYFLYLIRQIYHSGIVAMTHILRGNDAVRITTHRIVLTDEFAQNLLANAITLTPGTVSIDKQEDTLHILSFADNDGKPLVSEAAIRRIERILEGRPR